VNLLGTVDWQDANVRERFPNGWVPAPRLLERLAHDGQLDDVVDSDDLGNWNYLSDDPELTGHLANSGLWVDLPSRSAPSTPAPPIEQRPEVWLEATPLGDGRSLLMPGERIEEQTLSFWTPRATEPRIQILSMLIKPLRRIAGLRLLPTKDCTPIPQTSGVTCQGRAGGCSCLLQESLNGTTLVYVCDCQRA
jgi:hypothetical protein